MTKTEAQTAVTQVVKALVDTIAETGDRGAPGGVLYAALMAHGCSYEMFQNLMTLLVQSKKVVRRGDCYFSA